MADTSAGFIETADFFDIVQGSPIIAEITPDVLTNDEFSNSQWFSCYVYKNLKGNFSSDYTMIELCVPRGSMELNKSYIVMLKESVDNRFVVSSINSVFPWSEEIVDNIEKIAIYGEEYIYY